MKRNNCHVRLRENVFIHLSLSTNHLYQPRQYCLIKEKQARSFQRKGWLFKPPAAFGWITALDVVLLFYGVFPVFKHFQSTLIHYTFCGLFGFWHLGIFFFGPRTSSPRFTYRFYFDFQSQTLLPFSQNALEILAEAHKRFQCVSTPTFRTEAELHILDLIRRCSDVP